MTADEVHELQWWQDPGVMLPWCEAVGLDPMRVQANDFVVEHDDDGTTHVAEFTVLTGGPDVPTEESPTERRRMVLTLLPVECITHPDTPFVTRRRA